MVHSPHEHGCQMVQSRTGYGIQLLPVEYLQHPCTIEEPDNPTAETCRIIDQLTWKRLCYDTAGAFEQTHLKATYGLLHRLFLGDPH
jgi:hypothetical protein